MGTKSFVETERFWLCPLYGFNCDDEIDAFANGIEIVRAPEEFREYIETTHKSRLLYGEIDIPDWVFILPCSEAIEESEHGSVTSGAETIRAFNSLIVFVQACRIYQQGSISPGELILVLPTNREWSFGIQIRTYLSKDHRPLHVETVYNLKKADVPKINELMKSLDQSFSVEKQDSVNIALRRFNSAYQGDIEDRLIDQMIAFESLYIADDKELGYKLATRTAFFLGKSRVRIFRDMKIAYSLRGQIVHGRKKVKRSRLEDITPKTEEYLRKSIRKFLSLLCQGHSLEGIRDKLDENIFKNGRILAVKE